MWSSVGIRIMFYHKALGRFISADPLIVGQKQYAWLSSYQFASNTPIKAIDLDGLEGISAQEKPDGGYTTALDATFVQTQSQKQISSVMSVGNHLYSSSYLQNYGSISEADVLTTFEMWLDKPSGSFGEIALKVMANIGYSLVNSPYSLLTGKSIAGKVFNPSEKIDAFVDFVPGLLTGCLTKTGQVVKTTKKGLQGFNQFVKQTPDVTTTEGLHKGMKWQTRAGELFKQNKVSQEGLENFKSARQVVDISTKTAEEMEKKQK